MKIKKIILIVIFTFCLTNIFAKKVEVEKIKQVAKKAYELNLRKNHDPKIKKLLPNSNESEPEYFVVNFDSCFIVVAADDIVPPILGYCNKNEFDPENVNPGLKYLLGAYEREIKNLRKLNIITSSEIQKKWNYFLRDNQLKSVTTYDIVSPLLTTQWDQDWPFNDWIPNDDPVGCTAVALAQVLNF